MVQRTSEFDINFGFDRNPNMLRSHHWVSANAVSMVSWYGGRNRPTHQILTSVSVGSAPGNRRPYRGGVKAKTT
jgi:hypothetical protein